jgi:hypothetical protein
MYWASTSRCVLLLIVGLALLSASFVMACRLPAPSVAPPAPPPTQLFVAASSQPPDQPPPVANVASGELWNTVETFTGEGNETTSPFHISGSEWRITWTADAEYPEYAVFDAFVYRLGTQSMVVRRLSRSDDSAGDTTYIYEGGQDYHIRVVAANLRSWTITVEDCATKASFSPVQITRIYYKGRDQLKSIQEGCDIVEADEYVEIKNQGDCWQVIGGWVLKNISKGSPSFAFPVHMPCSCSWFGDYETCIEECIPPSPCALDPHQSIRVYTGEVHDESGGFCFYYVPGDIWDNEESDVAALYNSRGEEVSRRSYIIPAENNVPASE